MYYAQIHYALWISWIVYWTIRSRGNKKTLHSSRPGLRLATFMSFVIVAFIFGGWKGWPQTRILPHGMGIQITAIVLCVAGLAFSIWARNILGTNWSANPTIKEGHELITTGPYRFVRHPIYTGLLLALFGSLVVASGRIADIILFVIITVGLHFKSRIEEGFMMQTFPQAYPEYRRRTKAIIPFVL